MEKITPPQTDLEAKELEILRTIVNRTGFNYKDYSEALNFSIDTLVTWLFENDFTGSEMASHYIHLIFLRNTFKELSKTKKENENKLLKELTTYTNNTEMYETLDFTLSKIMPYYILVNMSGEDLANDCQLLIFLKDTFKELEKLENN